MIDFEWAERYISHLSWTQTTKSPTLFTLLGAWTLVNGSPYIPPLSFGIYINGAFLLPWAETVRGTLKIVCERERERERERNKTRERERDR